MTVIEYLQTKGFQWREINRAGQREAIMNCPFCGEKGMKFAINLETGAYNCMHRNTCGVSGSFWHFQKALGDEPKRQVDYSRSILNKPVRKYKRPDPIKERALPDEAAQSARGFKPETIKRFSLSYKDGAVMMPYYKDGVLTNIKYRSVKNKTDMRQEKDAEPCLYNRDSITTNELVIVEGEYDAIAMAEYGMNVVSVPNGASDFRWIETEWDWLERFKTIYLGLDNDAAGYTGMMELVAKLGAWRCRGVTWPKKDPNECLLAGIPKEQMWDCVAMAKEFPPAILVTTDHFIEQVNDLFANPDRLSGTPTAWEPLNKILRGWRQEELTVWSGRNGSGKSTILNQHMLDLAKRDVRTCVASLEMPGARYLRWAVIQHTGQANPNKDEITGALEWMAGMIYVVNTHEEIDQETLLDVFEYAARRYDVKHFIVDSLTRIKFNNREPLQEHKAFVSRLLSFAKKNHAHVHLVAHPRKGMNDNDKPGKVDIMGTGHISDLAHNVIIMWRPDDEEKKEKAEKGIVMPDAIMYVKKNREFGIEGGIRLRFDSNAKIFREFNK